MSIKCKPTCQYFRCAKKALMKPQKPSKRPERDVNPPAICTWVNDYCSGANCTFAYCEIRALLPDGTCELELRKKPIKIRDIEEEAKKEEFGVSEKVLKKIKKWEEF
ncbi:MAG: hypothetical protein QXI93_04150 [Candidatus Methanomethylicia archaeon]